MTNRFKGLDLKDRVPELTIDRGSWHCTGGRDQDHPQEKEVQKFKMVIWGGLTNICEKKRSKRQRRKGKINPFKCGVPKNSKEKWECLPQRSMQRNRGNNRMGKTRDLFNKIRDTKGAFHAKMSTIKDRNAMDLTEAEDSKKRWQEHTKELYKKDLHDPDNHDGVITQSQTSWNMKSSGP